MRTQTSKEINEKCNWLLKHWDYSTRDEYDVTCVLEEVVQMLERLTSNE